VKFATWRRRRSFSRHIPHLSEGAWIIGSGNSFKNSAHIENIASRDQDSRALELNAQAGCTKKKENKVSVNTVQ